MSLFRKTIAAFAAGALLALALSPAARAGIGDGFKAIEDAFGGPVVGQGATDGQTLTWDDTQKRWEPSSAGAGDITAVLVGTGLAVDTDTGDVTVTLDEELVDVAGVSPTADQFLGGTGAALAMRTAAQVRASLVLATTDSPTFVALTLSGASSGGGTATTVGFLATTEDVTAGSGAPNVLTAAESGKVITNTGATAQAYNELPAAAAGLCFTFVVSDADGIRITTPAASDDTIRVLSLVSPAAGYAESTTIGSTIYVVGISSTQWIAVSAVGTWTVSS